MRPTAAGLTGCSGLPPTRTRSWARSRYSTPPLRSCAAHGQPFLTPSTDRPSRVTSPRHPFGRKEQSANRERNEPCRPQARTHHERAGTQRGQRRDGIAGPVAAAARRATAGGIAGRYCSRSAGSLLATLVTAAIPLILGRIVDNAILTHQQPIWLGATVLIVGRAAQLRRRLHPPFPGRPGVA